MGIIVSGDKTYANQDEIKVFEFLKKELSDINGILILKPFVFTGDEFLNLDLIFFHRLMGILIIEVKGWDLKFINSLKLSKDLKFYFNGISYGNPLHQVKFYKERISFFLKKVLKKTIPINHLFAFPNLKESDYEKIENDLFKFYLNKEDIIFKDSKNILQKIAESLGRFEYANNGIDEEVKKLLFPYLNVLNKDFSEADIKLLDFYQESILYSFNKGYKIIRGAVGSGKSVVLIGKMIYEKIKDKNKKIVFTSFTNVLVNEAKEYVKNLIKIRELPLKVDDFDFVTINRLDFKKRYDLILCDESQDLSVNNFKVLKKNLENGCSIVFGVDETQRIYDNRNWKWSDVGFDARGRVKILKRCYRSGDNILKFSRRFLLKDKVLIKELKELELEEIISLKKSGEVEFILSKNENFEILNIIKTLLNDGFKENEIFLLVPFKKEVENMVKLLSKVCRVYGFSSDSKNEEKMVLKDALVVMPYHSSKGLERKVVIVKGVDKLPYKNSKKVSDIRRDRRVLYVAFTRASEKLVITSSSLNGFAKDIKEVINDNN